MCHGLDRVIAQQRSNGFDIDARGRQQSESECCVTQRLFERFIELGGFKHLSDQRITVGVGS